MDKLTHRMQDIHGLSLSEQQRKAAMHGSGPALVLAGPGSGKTTVITARVAHLVHALGVPPHQILTVTYNKAAQLEMQRRHEQLFSGQQANRAHFSTLHSFCYSILRDYEKRQGRRFTLIEGGNGVAGGKSGLLKSLYKEINGSVPGEDRLDSLQNEIGLVKNKMLRESDFKDEALETPGFASIYKAYEDYKRSHAYIDFDDMLTHALSILMRCPDLLAAVQARFSHYQVDEAQDLSRVQFEILKLLVGGPSPNLMLVADDDQSIYGFRGADSHTILDIRALYPDCVWYYLENNYRSTRHIVALTSQLIRLNEKRYVKHHTTHNSQGPEPAIVPCQDVPGQIAFILKKSRELLKEDAARKIAVLYRSNLSSVPLLEALERAGFSLSIRQNAVHFHKHWLVMDILAILRFALNPFDRDSFKAVYYKLNRYIQKVWVEQAASLPDRPVLDAILQSVPLTTQERKRITGLKSEFKKLTLMKPAHAMDFIEEGFKYLGSVKEFCKSSGQSFNELYGLFDTLRVIASGQKTISAFLDRVGELEVLLGEGTARRKDAVITLSTLHASKGLEYDVVFMADLTNDEIPGQRALHEANAQKNKQLLEEERRLFYVGMTRAKTHLFLLSPEKKAGVAQARSTFVNETASILYRNTAGKLHEGASVHHKKYGNGLVSAIDASSPERTVLEVDFKGKIRSLDLATCLENGILRFLP